MASNPRTRGARVADATLVRAFVLSFVATFAFVAAMPCPSASAQGWLADRRYLEGPGLRVGRLTVHPGVAAELGYDSNVFLEAEDPEGSFIMRWSGHVDVATPGVQRRTEGEAAAPESTTPRMVDFRGGIGASYYDFFHPRARDNVELDLDAAAIFNPEGRITLRLGDQYARTIRPFIDATPEGVIVPTYVRNTNVASAMLSMGSRSGLLQGVLGYRARYEGFRDQTFSYLDNMTHAIETRVSWRFLPQTTLIQRNEVEIQRYIAPDHRPLSFVTNNERIRSEIGLNGAITPTLSVTALGGYSAGFYRAADEFESWHAQAETRYRPTERSQMALGYMRRFNPSFIGNFVKSDRIYAEAQHVIQGRVMVRVDGHVSFDETGIAYLPDGSTPLGSTDRRSDVRLRLATYAEYRFTSWFGIMATMIYREALTDYQFAPRAPDSIDPILDPGAGFRAFEAWLGMRVAY